MATFDDDELADMRATVEETFTDSCVIRAPGSAPFDPETGSYAPLQGEAVYDGTCRIAPTGGERVVVSAGDAVTLRTYVLRVPYTVTTAEVGQSVEMTTTDEALNGKTLRVVDVQGRSDVLGRVLIVEDDLG